MISSGIATQLHDSGHRVSVFHRGERAPIHGVKAIRGDRNSVEDLEAVRAADHYDVVVDMICFNAAQANVAVDVFGGVVTQWIHCSTVDVYRKDAGPYPLREDAERGAEASFPYAVGKIEAETTLEEAATAGAFALTIVRPAATYLNSAVAPFGSFRLMLERIRQGRPVILPGDGSSIWSAVHRDDVALAFAHAVGNRHAFGRAYHVAGEELLTWREYWRTIGRAMGVSPYFVYIPTDVLSTIAGDDASWCVENFQFNNIFDCSAARADLGFRYRTNWEQGVARFDFAVGEIDEHEDARYEQVLRAWCTGDGRRVLK